MARVSESSARVLAIAGNTFREAIRMRLFLLLTLAGVGSLAVGLFFQEFNLGASELKFIADFGFGGMTLLGSIMAVVVSAQLLYGEIEHRTILPLLSKPLSRGEFALGKLLGVWLTTCSLILILAVSLVVALWIRESQLVGEYPELGLNEGSLVSYGGVAVFAGLQCFRLLLLASATLLFASYATSQMFAFFMGFFFWVIGQLHSVAFRQLSYDSWLGEAFSKSVGLAIPNLRLFDLGGDVIEGRGIEILSAGGLVVYAIAYSALYTALASWALRNREI